MTEKKNISQLSELHPLEPFLPRDAKILILGTFPPKPDRWAMDFYYPNFQNDMWRIVGLVFHGDKGWFLAPGGKKFDRDKLVCFCREKGIALSDTAEEVVRLRDNASDRFLQITVRRDLAGLLERIPDCHDIVATGQKAAETVQLITGCDSLPGVGESIGFRFAGRALKLWRMPSSSRAYPIATEKKAEIYRKMFAETGLL